MKVNLTLLALLLGFCQLAKAQTTDPPSYKHQVGIVASPTLYKVFTSNTSLPVGLIYKRQGNASGVFRSTLIGSQSGFGHSSSYLDTAQDYTSGGKGFSVQLTGGYEWHLPLNNKWFLYYGAEAGPYLGRHNYESYNPFWGSGGQGRTSQSEQHRTWGAIIRPFSGLAYQVTDRLYIATETAIVASLYRSKNKTTHEQTTPENKSSTERSYKTNSSNIHYKPIANISILMRF